MTEISTNTVKPRERVQQGRARDVSLVRGADGKLKPFMSEHVRPRGFRPPSPDDYPTVRKVQARTGLAPIQVRDLPDIASRRARERAVADRRAAEAAGLKAKPAAQVKAPAPAKPPKAQPNKGKK